MMIKGAVLQARIAFVKQHFGDGQWQKVLDALQPADREIMSGIITLPTWYPFKLGERLDQAIVDILGNGELRVFEQIGVESARKNLQGAHKSFLTSDPQKLLEKTPSIYRFYYDTGYRTYTATGPTSGVITTHDAETFSMVDCLTVIGWYKEALRMSGAKGPKIIEHPCRAKGGDVCRYTLQWSI